MIKSFCQLSQENERSISVILINLSIAFGLEEFLVCKEAGKRFKHSGRAHADRLRGTGACIPQGDQKVVGLSPAGDWACYSLHFISVSKFLSSVA